MKWKNSFDNQELTAIWNWDIAYNRMINKELLKLIWDDEINEEFKSVANEVKDLIIKKEWIPNVDVLKQKIDEIIYKNKSRLPSFEYFLRYLKVNINFNHNHQGLLPDRWEKEMNDNIDNCLNKCLSNNIVDDNLIKQIIDFTIIKQWFEYKRKREESMPFLKEKTKANIVHYLDDNAELE